MFFAEPQPTQYDLHFMVGDVPVRVHPMFWLVTILLGSGGNPAPIPVALWVVAVFISILVHEFGHVLAFRYYGIRSHVVLQAMGGLAVPDTMSSVYGRRRDSLADIIIAFAGPAAGFLLAALIWSLVLAAHGRVFLMQVAEYFWLPDVQGLRSPYAIYLADQMLYINIFWGLINLLPIFPLDGGRISAAVFSSFNPQDGQRQSFVLSIAVALVMAVLVYFYLKDAFMAIFFAFMAYNNYQILQAISGGRGGWR
ncbi:MAG TPA: site-2 protease family protein [Pirellulales bacterium]